ncbi:RNase adapter RapZ [Myxococcota bacterium]|nr:RNase adapter RapZ [Myxococcota bacterium]
MSSETSPPGTLPRLTVVTGLSGSGISTAIHALEDLGWFCVDNLPPPLVPKLVELARDAHTAQRLAIGLDARGISDPSGTVALLRTLEQAGAPLEILFLDAQEPVLLRRFSESRRRHPWSAKGTPLPDALRAERGAMHPLREVATWVLDTSDLNVHECKRRVQAWAQGEERVGELSLAIVSFGFRHGLPPEADVVWDVRFLPNPHFIPELKPQTGLDVPVRDFVLGKPETTAFLDGFLPLLESVLPHYEVEGKSYLTVAIGCTGGRHRSVAIAEQVTAHLTRCGRRAVVRHRDIDKDVK